jgi:RNA polymerase primary sigma factor
VGIRDFMPIDEPDDPVEMYLREMGSIPPLTSEEQTALFQQLGSSGKWNDEQESAAKRIIESQLPLVVRIARRYSSTGLPMLDIIQEGNLGLLRAVKHYAEQPTGDFPASAASSIEDAIVTYVRQPK